MHHVILYSKPGCHLCEITYQLLLGLRREFELAIVQVDITTDPELLERYRDTIPVLLVDGQTTFVAPIHVADIRAALDGKLQE